MVISLLSNIDGQITQLALMNRIDGHHIHITTSLLLLPWTYWRWTTAMAVLVASDETVVVAKREVHGAI